MRENTLKRRMQAGETVLGSWLSLPDAVAAEAMAQVGFDWLLIDMEHGPAALNEAAAMLTAVRTTGVTGIIRVAWNESSQIQRTLDLGCAGILVPVINTAEDARRVVRDARFPPLGERSRGGVRTTLAFATDAMTYFERANDEVLVLVQIETELAVENVDEVLAVEGIDGVFVGPNDLAASGLKRWPDVWSADEAYMTLVRRVSAAARKAGKVAGFLARDAKMAVEVDALGYNFVGVSGDVNIMTAAAKRALDEARAGLQRAQPAAPEPPVTKPAAGDPFDDALEPVRRRMERARLQESFVRGLFREGAVLDPNDVALQWAGMPNKNERAVTIAVLDALAAAGFLGRDGDLFRVLRAPD
jgi:2-keto-3-deoxy-L-rhamnonate aldolase RhmA